MVAMNRKNNIKLKYKIFKNIHRKDNYFHTRGGLIKLFLGEILNLIKMGSSIQAILLVHCIIL